MHHRFDALRASPLGRQLLALIQAPQRYTEFAALSRAKIPAVAAIVDDLTVRFPETARDQFVRQFCGSAVADVMREHRHEIVQTRGRVPGGYFTYGAVWSPYPVTRDFDWLTRTLSEMPDRLSEILGDPAPRAQRTEMAMAVAQKLCDYAQTDALRTVNVNRILSEDAPVLDTRAERYSENESAVLDLAVALEALRRSRGKLCSALATASVDQVARFGILDGVWRTTILDIACEANTRDEAIEADLLAQTRSGQRFTRMSNRSAGSPYLQAW